MFEVDYDHRIAADQTKADPLLGTAEPATLREWFVRLSEGGRVVDDLQPRPWGAHDGVVVDQYGLKWLIGFEGEG